ncbi:FecR family protein [Portibacter marinus]|uniref:FecR family protein n=1 Tax=Portibacter marinus TaxID=2898660 RepID=UPI001F4127CA|nr:FecR domain-containing protein [Portibacter marinus]
MIEEKDILTYLDGNSSAALKERVEAWIKESTDHKEEFEFTKMMWEESSAAADYVQFDLEEEWQVFEESIDKDTPQRKEKEPFKVVPIAKRSHGWRTNLAVAASLTVLIASTWLLWPQSEYIEIVEAAEEMNMELEDGSLVNIKKGASFKTKRTYQYDTKRNITIAGEVKFDVVRDTQRPFIVETEESAVEVLGTIFNIKTQGIESEVANEEGLVKFYIIDEPENYVTLEEGDVMKYDGTGFIDMNEPDTIPQPPAPRVIPKVQDVLQYLRRVSRGRVTFGSGIGDHILADMDIDYEGKSVREVIRLMEEKALVVVLSKGCPTCFEITEIIPRNR